MMLLHDGPLCYFLKKNLTLATDPRKTHLWRVDHLRNRFTKCITSAELYSVPHVVGTLLNADKKQLPEEAKTITFALRCVRMHKPKGVRRVCVRAFKYARM